MICFDFTLAFKKRGLPATAIRHPTLPDPEVACSTPFKNSPLLLLLLDLRFVGFMFNVPADQGYWLQFVLCQARGAAAQDVGSQNGPNLSWMRP